MEPDKKSYGALVGAIIIIVILLIGGVYLFQKASQNRVQTQEVTEDVSDILAPDTSASTPTKIESELDQIDLNSLDSDL